MVVAFMKLAQANRLLGVSGLSSREGRPFKKERLERRDNPSAPASKAFPKTQGKRGYPEGAEYYKEGII